jgi:flavin reductase (DIM6/NTAB) family NADH-FMN oxidoreductase RutF
MNQPYPIQLDSRSLRDALGEFATGVAVVTARSANGAAGRRHHQFLRLGVA